MPRILSESDYHRVITYKKDLGMTNVAIAEDLGIRRQTVAAIIKREATTGTPVVQIRGNKRKTKSAETLRTPRQINRLRETSLRCPFKTPRVLKNELRLRCSLSTIKRRLRDVHLNGRRTATTAYLTPAAKEKRVQFARHHMKLDWTRVVFTDEVKIETSAHGMNWVRRPPGTRYDPRYTRSVNRQGRCSIMVWSGLTYSGMLDLVFLDGTLDQHKYLNDILKTNVLPYKRTHKNMIFQHDGAGPHRAKIVIKWLEENDIEVLKWPAQSPDLNLIENLWNLLKDEIGSLNHIGPSQREELIEVVTAAWETLRQNTRVIRKLYGSMRKRLQQTIDKNGSATKY